MHGVLVVFGRSWSCWCIATNDSFVYVVVDMCRWEVCCAGWWVGVVVVWLVSWQTCDGDLGGPFARSVQHALFDGFHVTRVALLFDAKHRSELVHHITTRDRESISSAQHLPPLTQLIYRDDKQRVVNPESYRAEGGGGGLTDGLCVVDFGGGLWVVVNLMVVPPKVDTSIETHRDKDIYQDDGDDDDEGGLCDEQNARGWLEESRRRWSVCVCQ